MKIRRIPLLATLLIASTLLIARRRPRSPLGGGRTTSPSVPAPPEPTPVASRPSASSGPPPPVVPPSEDLLRSARAAIVAHDPGAVRAIAERLRREAARRPVFLQQLGAMLADTSVSPEFRELAAFVLGSLPAKEAQGFLAQALAAAREPEWQAVLILALGCAKPADDEEGVFDQPETERWIRRPIGLEMRLDHVFVDETVRRQIVSFLTGAHPEAVRDAAVEALIPSLDFGDVRGEFLRAVRSETAAEVLGRVGFGLTEWAARRPEPSPEQREIVVAVLDRAREPEANALRFLTERGLTSVPLTIDDVRSMAALLPEGDFDRRRWAIAVLGDRAKRPELPGRDGLYASFADLARRDADPKIREYAVGALASFPDRAETADNLVGAFADDAWHVRAAAARAMGRLKRNDEKILSVLRSAAERDENDMVRRAAAEALELLGR